MAKNLGTIELFARELSRALEPLQEELEKGNIRDLFAELGLEFPPELESQTAFVNALNSAITSAATLPSLVTKLETAVNNDELIAIIQAISDIGIAIGSVITAINQVVTTLSGLGSALPGISASDLATFTTELGQRLLNYTLISYLEGYYPVLLNLLALVGIVKLTPMPGDPTDAHKPPFLRRELKLSSLPDFLGSPGNHFKTLYKWGEAGFEGEKLIEQFYNLLFALSIPAIYKPSTGPGIPSSLEILLVSLQPKTDISPKGFEIVLNAALTKGTTLDIPFIFDNWSLQIEMEFDAQAGSRIIFQPGGNIALIPPSGKVEGKLGIFLAGTPGSGEENFLLFGRAGGSRLTASSIKAGALVGAGWIASENKATGDFGFEARMDKGELVFDLSEGDSFISKIFASKEVKFEFDLSAGWNSANGFYFGGGAGLEVMIPAHLDLGPVDLNSVYLSLQPTSGKKKIPIDLALSASAALGPLNATVDRIGVTAEFGFPDSGGNLGPLNLELKFKPPTAIGLSIDGGGFKGGGFLSFDPQNERYVGFLEIKFQNVITLKAIGLITTRLPGEKKGFSLLIIITTEFTPIQLGFGFTLIGVGGLLGLNRTVKIDVLRQGIKTNALTSVLFPRDIVKNATKIISDLRQIFPPQEDRFVFGPMAKFGWGTPTLISVELGLIIEVPSPVRIAIPGVFKTILPDEKLALIKIQVNFLGSWEEDKQLIAFDAGLFDSRILRMPLAGDMAFRLGYGDNPNFLVTAGGFHPSYTPPPLALPDLARISINLIGGNNPRLALTAYFAVTSNTVQFGAKIELLAKAWKFNVYGFLAFDALFQFSPFYFIVAISGGVAVRIGSTVLFSISLKLSLEGPTPWKAKGTASFKICWFIKVKVRFSKTWGEKKDTSLPDVKVLPKLVEALQHKNNWEAKLPSRNNLLVSIRKIEDVDAKHIVAHPAGVLTVSQKIVPLETKIDKFGSQKPSDANRFTIEKVRSNGIEFKKSTVKEFFAPAQFEEMDDAQKLSRKSFERMPAGVKVSSTTNDIQSSKVVSRKVVYETFIIDTRFRILRFVKFLGERLGTFLSLIKGSAVAKSRLSFVNNAEPVLGPGKIKAAQEGYTVVGTGDLLPFDGNSSFGSEMGAFGYMRELIQNNPSLKDEIQVVPNYEIKQAA